MAEGQRNADSAEVEKFAALASRWWDPSGEFAPLHKINPLRLDYLESEAGVADRQCLDCGCGGGLLTEGLIARGARSVLGIDLAAASLEVARLHAQSADLTGIDYQLISSHELAKTQANSFDLVTCMEVLEHVPNPGELMADLAHLVRPGGDIVVTTLNRNARAFALGIVGAEYVAGLLPRGTHEYQRFIRPAELAEFGRAAGLELCDLTGIEMQLTTGEFRLSDDVRVNYLAHFKRRKPA